MDADKINLFLSAKREYIPSSSFSAIKQSLEDLPNERESEISAIELKSPMVALIISIFIGWLGIDRFYIGDKYAGFGKLGAQVYLSILSFVVAFATVGIGCIFIAPICYAWWLIDLFFIVGATKKKNLEKLMLAIG